MSLLGLEGHAADGQVTSSVAADPLSEGTVASLARELRTTYALRADLENELARAAAARREALSEADAAIAQAQTVATSLVAIATEEAAEIRREARARAQSIVEEAERDAEVILEKAFADASAAHASRIDGLERVAAELRRCMESTVTSLDQVEGELSGDVVTITSAPEPRVDRRPKRLASVERDGEAAARQKGWRK